MASTRTYSRLLAKSVSGDAVGKGATLPGHTANVLRAADELLALRGRASLDAAGLPPEWRHRLSRVVRLAAFLHDLGKCSDHFQAMVRGERSHRQLVRHEALSGLLALGKPLRSWLEGTYESAELLLAVVCALGHHRKFRSAAVAPNDAGAGTSIICLVSHADFANTLRVGEKRLGLAPFPVLAWDVEFDHSSRNPLEVRFDEIEDELDSAGSGDSAERRLLAVAKALVLTADVSGSALPPTGTSFRWIAEQLEHRAQPDDIARLVSRRLGGHSPRSFQRQMGESANAITVVRAGCGSGKTAGAYLWAAQHVPRQIWFCYPTTGTATEGYRDYLFGADVDSRLEHSRRFVDLRMLFAPLDESEPWRRERDRLDALQIWGAPLVACTVDTVLGLIQNQRKGLYAWPALANSAVVFDEVHAFDSRLFDALLRFLRALPGVPVLIMTASLQHHRVRALQEVARQTHGDDLRIIQGPAELESVKRYYESSASAVDAVRTAYGRGHKVLYVVNTVGRALAVAEQFSEYGPIVYHSRFKYRDRLARHAEVINAFSQTGPCVVVTTQVAEMSLDISADLLVTERAPVPAMIQRLGRLNRRAKPGDEPMPFVVVDVESSAPYDDDQMDEAARWLARLPESVSQGDLVQAWQPSSALAVGSTPSAWLDGWFSTEPRNLREQSPGLDVLLVADEAEAKSDLRAVVELSVPMPPPPARVGNWRAWPRVAFVPVAPRESVLYDPRRGAQWA